MCVIGGGIIGLSCAWAAHQAGWQVTVLDAAAEARQASWAAGGMLAPHNEANEAGPLWAFGCESLALWPQFLAELNIAVDDVDFRQNGGLVPFFHDSDQAAVSARASFLQAAGVELAMWSGSELRRREPQLSHACSGALWVPGAQVNPRLVTQLLHHRLQAAGVSCRYACPVARLDGPTVYCVDETIIETDIVVLASGAWTPALAELTGLALPGEPVKGQMIRFAAADGLLHHFIHCEQAYCIPRSGCGIVVGASMVESGFDTSSDAEAIAHLAAGARDLLPLLSDCELAEEWTGLRPRLRGALPYIDRVNEYMAVATGHFRNGILMAPATGRLLVDRLAGRPIAPAYADLVISPTSRKVSL